MTKAIQPVGSIVTERQFETSLEKVRERVRNPKAGLFGPGSLAWKLYGQNVVVGLAAPKILLLQTTHPYVAHGVQQHSNYRTDPAGRGIRTANALFSWIFEDLDHVIETAAAIRVVHHHVAGRIANDVGPYNKGDAYTAADSNALLWVHATLWAVPVQVQELLYGPIDPAEKERYWEQTKLFALLFGIPEDIIPPTWRDFLDYVDRMIETNIFTADQAAKITPKYMFGFPPPSVPSPVRVIKLITTGLMPEKIRREYGWKFGPAEQAAFDRWIKRIRAISLRLPAQVRYSPAYRHAAARMRPKPPAWTTRLYLNAESQAIRRLNALA